MQRLGRLAAILLALGAALSCAPRDERLSVLLVTLDTTRADALSCLGAAPGTTPRLDALAASSALWPIAPDHPILGTAPQVFDLAHDPGEMRDLAEQEPARVAELRRLIDPWVARGPVARDTEHVSPEALEQLRALGYLRD